MRNYPHRVVSSSQRQARTHAAHVQRFNTANIHFLNSSAALTPLLCDADVATGYASSGFTAQALLAGVPMLLLPQYVEQYLCARKVAEMGAAITLGSHRDVAVCREALERLFNDSRFSSAAKSFADCYRNYSAEAQANEVSQLIIQLPQKINREN